MRCFRTILFACACLLPGCLDVPPPPGGQADVRVDTGTDAAADGDAGEQPDADSGDLGVDPRGADVDTGDARPPEDTGDVTPDMEADVDAGPDLGDTDADACQPDCFGKVCGGNGCGGLCGECDDGASCEDGICQIVARPWEEVLEERAGYGAEATGGAGASLCVVTSAEDNAAPGTLRHCAAQPGGRWVRFEVPGGTVIRPATPILVGADTTVDGRGSDVVISGRGLAVRNIGNVILLHLRVMDGDDVPENDGIQVQGSQNVWIHHCTVRGWTDGAVDVTRGARAVTLSWSHLARAAESGSLAGDPAEEFNDGAMRMTYHHNWFQSLVNGAPRVREAWVHVVNNLYTDWGGTAIVATHDARALVQANYFDPDSAGTVALDYQLSSHPNGKTRSEGNESSRSIVLRENGTVNDPPYVFNVEGAGSALAERIRDGAGRQAIPFPGL